MSLTGKDDMGGGLSEVESLLTGTYRGISYADLKTNTPICQNYVSAMRVMGHHTVFDNTGKGDERFGGGSTDMGMSMSHLMLNFCMLELTQSRKCVVCGARLPRDVRHPGRRRQPHASVHKGRWIVRVA